MSSHQMFPFIMDRPMIWVRFAEDKDGSWTQPVAALIDTGSDYSTIPAKILEEMIGRKLEKGRRIRVSGIGGEETGYLHRITIEVLRSDESEEPAKDEEGHYKLFKRITKHKIIFVENNENCCLGVSGFLQDFVLKIDYPKSHFYLLDGEK
jgi:predicted aspartyl protease